VALVALYIFLGAVFEYQRSVSLVTNQRLILVDQRGFWQKIIKELPLDKIVESRVVKKGIIESLADCGSIEIFSGGTHDPESVAKIPRVALPYEILQEIGRISN
jgi:hypothetical protein